MKYILKNIYVVICTLFLILTVAFAAGKEDAPPPHFQIQNASGQQNVTIFDARDGNYYVFLPSYAELEQVRFIHSGEEQFCLDDIRLQDQMTCEDFELDRSYRFSADGKDMGTLRFCRSQNVATLYMDTVSGEMTKIHEDVSYEEHASMTLYLPDGSIHYHDDRSRLKGRGNATWDLDKRPYLLTLSQDGDLLGMGSAQKWVLLANAYDETNLNNKLVFDLASRAAFAWSPDSQFVDLYLNGEYSGLYLLTEKVEVHPNRLDLDAASGESLCQIELWNRREKFVSSFESSLGRLVGVSYPEVLSASAQDELTYLIWLLETELYAETDLADSEILDLDSWVRRYLIDEISGNIDSDLTSSFFYFSEGKFFAGPVWDYDMAFGNNERNQEPWGFIAKNEWKTTAHSSPYYGPLWRNESFRQRVAEIYRREFAPVLQEWVHGGLDAQIEFLRPASEMNSIRWRYLYDARYDAAGDVGLVRNTEELKAYFTRRIQFLNSVWLENKDFCTVQFARRAVDHYWNISVEKGTCLETDYMDLVNTQWVDTKTGEVVDFRSPITQDLIVMPKSVAESLSENNPAEEAVPEEPEGVASSTADDNVFFHAGVFLAVFVLLLMADRSRRGRKKPEHEKQKTVS